MKRRGMRIGAPSVLVFAGLASFAAAACEDAPLFGAMPDGTTATALEMQRARAEVGAYLATMESYLGCLDEELRARGDGAPVEYKELMSKRILAGKDERRAVAGAFNRELEAYFAATRGGEGP